MAHARSVRTDLFQNHRFQVIDSSGRVSGGFSAVTLPEITVDMAEYREGLWNYPKKYPTKAHISNQVSLHRGVATAQSDFYKWMLSCAEGGLKYRSDIVIKQFHRSNLTGFTSGYSDQPASREIRCYTCMPVRYRPGTDHDASSADVSIEELDLEVNYIRIFVDGQEVTT